MYKGYMPVENAKKIIDELEPYLDSVGLTGMGETLLYKDLEEIVNYIKAKNSGLIISLSTNAVVPNFIDRITPLIGKVDTIQISIDGLEEVYNSIRLNTNFSILDDNIKQLTNSFANTDTTFMFNTVVTKENYMQMADIASYAEKMGIHYVNFTLFNLVSVTGVPADYYSFYKTPEFIEALKALDKRKSELKTVEVTNWDYEAKSEFQKCPFPWSHFPICVNGDVPPCCSKPFPAVLSFGNVFEKGVMPVLNSAPFQNFRKAWYANKAPAFCSKCHFIEMK
jgi:MoaA/NifB/PqqE/SkfB family radical SAM enzyme